MRKKILTARLYFLHLLYSRVEQFPPLILTTVFSALLSYHSWASLPSDDRHFTPYFPIKHITTAMEEILP